MLSGRLFKFLVPALLLTVCSISYARKDADNTYVKTPEIQSFPAAGVVVPFEYFRQHIYVTLTVNGKICVFLLDSGANRNILNLRTARLLGIAPQRMEIKKEVGFGDTLIYVGPKVNVNVFLNSVQIDSELNVIDLNRFEQYFHHPVDGILGYPFFQKFVVRLDFEHNQMILPRPDGYRYHGMGEHVGISTGSGFMVIPVVIGSTREIQHTIDVIVDTGSNATLMLNEKYVRKYSLQESFYHTLPTLVYGLDGPFIVDQGNIHSLEIGDAKTLDPPLDYLRSQEDRVQNIPGVIGNGLLHSFRVVIFDVPQKRMIFEVKPAPLEVANIHSTIERQ